MQSIINAAMWGYSATYNASASQSEGDAFGLMLDALKKGGASAQDALLDMLGQRFPGMNFSVASAPDGAKGAETVAGNSEGDHVAIDPAAAETISGSRSMQELLEKALAAFSGTAGQTQAAEGTYVQRAVMVTTISVRVSLSRYSGETGELLSASEMKTAFTEKLQEMIRNFFGGAAETENEEADGEEKESGSGETAKAENGTASGSGVSSAWAASVSFSLYYSSALISRLGSGESGLNASQVSGAFQFAAQGGFQGVADNFFPYAIFNGLQNSGFGSGPFTSMLNGALDQMGLATESMWQQDGGYFLKLRESRDLIAELMGLYNKNAAASGAAAAESGSETDAVTAEEAAAMA